MSGPNWFDGRNVAPNSDKTEGTMATPIDGKPTPVVSDLSKLDRVPSDLEGEEDTEEKMGQERASERG